MTPEERGGYINLICYAWQDGECSLPNDETLLARLSGLGEGWLKGCSTAIMKMFEVDPNDKTKIFSTWLRDEREKQRRHREASIRGGKNSVKSRGLALKGTSTGQVEGALNPSSSSSSSSSDFSHKKKNIKKEKSINPDFEKFYELYPRKEAKARALKAFEQLKPDEKLLGVILTRLELQVNRWRATGTASEFIPLPATWLNGERWEDEVTNKSNSGGKKPGVNGTNGAGHRQVRPEPAKERDKAGAYDL